jgi:hypothetical protein
VLTGAEILVAVQHWIAAQSDISTNINVKSEIQESPPDRDPRSVRWILEGAEMMGQIIVWEDGQAELDLANAATGDVQSEHRNITNETDLESALSAVRDWTIRS